VHAFEASLTRDLDGFVFEGHDGDCVEFDDVGLDFDQRGSLHNPAASMELRREGQRIVVYHWHDIDEPVQKYVFDARQGERMLLVARALPSGQGLEIARDRQARVATVTQISERRRLYFGYDHAGRLESLRPGLASQGSEVAFEVARYRYDARSRLAGVLDAHGAEQRYGYDDAGRLTLEQGGGSERPPHRVRLRRDGLPRPAHLSGLACRPPLPGARQPGSTASLVAPEAFDYDGRDQCTLRKLGEASEKRQYDLQGRLRHQSVPGINSRSFLYDGEGAVTEILDELRGRRQYESDAAEHSLAAIRRDALRARRQRASGPPGFSRAR
jgi:YD repeat-containing protein